MLNGTPSPPEQASIPTYVTPQWSKPASYIGAVLLIVIGVIGFILLGPVIQVLFVAFILTFLMYLPSRSIANRTRIPYTVVVVTLYALLLVLLAVLIFAVIPSLIDSVNSLWISLRVSYDNFIVWLSAYQPGDVVVTILGFQVDLDPYIRPLQRLLAPEPSTLIPLDLAQLRSGEQTPNELLSNISIARIVSAVIDIAGGITRLVTSVVGSAAGFVATIGLAFFISFLTLLDMRHARGMLVAWVPPHFDREARLLLSEIDRVWIGFFKGQVVVGGLLSLLAYIQFTLMGVPGALPLAIMNGFVSLIPNIGGLLSSIPIFLVTMLRGSTSPAFADMSNLSFSLLVFIIMAVYSQIVYNVVSPLVVGKSVNLPVVVIIVGVFIGFALGGIIGAFLVVPVISTLRIVLGYMLSKITHREPFPGEPVPEMPKLGFFSQLYAAAAPEAPVVEADTITSL
jgi:predicted PurR-regulated permease PerM